MEIKLSDIQIISNIVASVISVIALVFCIIQIHLQRKSMKKDYERSRREKGIEILQHWFSNLDKNNSTARKLAEGLSEEILLSIWHCESCIIPATKINRKYLDVLFPEKDIKKSGIRIDAHQATEIRWQLISYLNVLENVVAAWKYNIVDRDLIEAEFKYMFDHKGGALKKFRELLVDAYPCIDLFELEMKNKYTAKISENYEKL